MKRLSILGFIAFAGLLFAPAAVIGDPAGPPGGLEVTVVNPTLSVNGQMEVTNDDTNPVPVEVVDNPTIIAVQKQIGMGCGQTLPLEIYTVPQNARLVIEYVSFRILSGPGLAVAEIAIETNVQNEVAEHPINVPPVVTVTTSTDTLAYCNGGQVTKIYADPGTTVRGWNNVFFSSYCWAGFLNISGHLIPYESSE